MRITLEDTICMVVDYQEKLMPAIYEQERLVRNSLTLLRGMEILGVPMIVTAQYPTGLGETIPEIAKAAGDTDRIAKTSFSAYEEPEVQRRLAGKRFVVLCGIEAHICVMQTALDLKEAGYQPVMVVDCLSSRTLEDKQVGMMRAQQEGILLTTGEALLFELTRKSGTPVFKEISRLIKSVEKN